MGEGYEQYLDALCHTPRVIGDKQKPYWQTKDGEHIALGEMSNSHLANSIRLLQRKQLFSDEYQIEVLLNLLSECICRLMET